MLEVFTETRPNIQFREKRDIATIMQPFTEETSNDSNLIKESTFLKRLRGMSNCDDEDCEKTEAGKKSKVEKQLSYPSPTYFDIQCRLDKIYVMAKSSLPVLKFIRFGNSRFT